MVRRAALVVLTALGFGCADSEVTAPAASPGGVELEPSLALPPPVQSIQGQLGPGALYEIMVPPLWNGTLILYAHGYTDPDAPLAFPDVTDPDDPEGQLLAAVTSLGFATAYSSFSENGLAVKDGAQRTKQLLGIFEANFGPPARTLVAGASLGGMIAVKMVEEHPDLYAGALAVCAFVGGTRAQVDYTAHVRVLFDVFYPNVIPGDLFNLPPEADRPALLLQAAGAITADPLGALAMQAVMAGLGMPIPGSGAELGESILTALAFNFDGFEDLLSRTHGHVFFDNTGTDYGDPVVNLAVGRFQATPDALNYLAKYYQPTGDLQVPVVTLHTSRDPVVPVFHEALYDGIVTGAGSGALLDQFLVDRYGHCNFEPAEVFNALVFLLGLLGP